jgi:hypothetical protein
MSSSRPSKGGSSSAPSSPKRAWRISKARVLDGARHGDRLGVAVQRDQASLRPEARQQQAAVAAAAEGAVQVGPVEVGLGVQQRVHRLVQQHGDMRPGRCGGG